MKIYLFRKITVLFLSFVCGAFLLSCLSMLQKHAIGAPLLNFKGYFVPLLFGGISGSGIGFWIYRLKESNLEKELKKEKLRLTLDSIGDAVIVVNVEGNITRMNSVAENVTGWTFAEASGVTLGKIFYIKSSLTGDIIDFPISEIISGMKVIHLEHDIVLRSKSGEEFEIEDSAAPIYNSSGKCFGVIIVFKDVTEKHHMEQMLRQKHKMEAMGNLAGGVAHDFNNMLTGILGFTELLLTRNPDEKSKHYIDMIINTTENASALTENLLTFARKSELDFKPHFFSDILEMSVELLKRTVNNSIKIEVTSSIPDGVINCDFSRIESLIVNLGINSRDAMPHGGTISIEVEGVRLDDMFCKMCSFDIHEGDYIEMSFRDTGQGMSCELQGKIFDPFFTTKKAGEGTGLGLAAVYGTVKEHGGAVTVHSEEGEGTTFNVYLPLIDFEVNSIEEVDEKVETGTGRVLICDDEETVRELGNEILSELGYEIYFAESGPECIAFFEKNPEGVDLIILDVNMPGFDGRECFSRLKEMNRKEKIIVCSGSVKDSSLNYFREFGFFGFLQKPFRRKDLAKMVHDALSQVNVC